MKMFEVVYSLNNENPLTLDDWWSIAIQHCSECVCSPLHPCDTESSHEHYHIIGRLLSDNTPEVIAKWFGISANNVEKIKGKYETARVYITSHFGHSDKTSLNPCDARYYPVDLAADILASIDKYKFNDILKDFSDNWIDRVHSGLYTRSTPIHNKDVDKCILTLKLRSQWDTAIHNAEVRFRDERVKGGKNMVCFWIYGNAGQGKTSFAKWLGIKKERDIYITSSGSNPFDDYYGEKCVIIDDLGNSASCGIDQKSLLKLLDIHNDSFTHARYNNKFIDAEIIIITSSVSPMQWWKSCGGTNENGNQFQLLRRLNGGVVRLENDVMYVDSYDGHGNLIQRTTAPLPPDVVSQIHSSDSANDIFRMYSSFGIDLHIDFNPDDLPFE